MVDVAGAALVDRAPARRAVPVVAAGEPAPPPRLRAVWRLLLFVAAVAAGGALASGIVYPIVLWIGRATGSRPLVAEWLSLAAVAFATWLLLRRIERRPWSHVGLGDAASRPGLLARGTLVGTLAILVPSLLLLAAGLLRAEQAAGGTAAAWLDGAARVLWVLLPAALTEELLFRGYPLLVLQESAGTWPALLLTSAVFGLVHAQNPNASPAFVLVVAGAGIFLGAVRLATGSLWAAFAAHLAWNFALTGVLHAAVSGAAFPTPGYRVVDAGPDWLTGGAWGPEGGAGAVAGMLAVTWWYRRALPVGRRAVGPPAGSPGGPAAGPTPA